MIFGVMNIIVKVRCLPLPKSHRTSPSGLVIIQLEPCSGIIHSVIISYLLLAGAPQSPHNVDAYGSFVHSNIVFSKLK